MATFTELSLFSGAGGGLLATQHLLGWRTICYVEWDKYAVEILKARIRDGYLHDAPIWDDAFTFDGRPWAGLVDVVTAGFPCQPFSVAGKGLAENDPRNAWPAVIRILREVRPRFALLENVPGLISKPYFRRILGDLAEAGFDIEQDCISAQEVGAPHLRERLWIVAHAKGSTRDLSEVGERHAQLYPRGNGNTQLVANTHSGGRGKNGEHESDTPYALTGLGEEMANSNHKGLEKREGVGRNNGKEQPPTIGAGWWTVEPNVGRVAHGVAARVDRLKALGNGQVPRVAATAWRRHGKE